MKREPRQGEQALIHVTKQRLALVDENYDPIGLNQLLDSLPYIPGLEGWEISETMPYPRTMQLDEHGNLILVSSETLKRLRKISGCKFSVSVQGETVSHNRVEWQGEMLVLETTLTASQKLSPSELTTLADLEQRAAIALMGKEPT